MKEGELTGWKGVGPNKGKFVPVEEGFAYMADQIGIVAVNPKAPEANALPELVDWYFSGNWVEVREDG